MNSTYRYAMTVAIVVMLLFGVLWLATAHNIQKQSVSQAALYSTQHRVTVSGVGSC